MNYYELPDELQWRHPRETVRAVTRTKLGGYEITLRSGRVRTYHWREPALQLSQPGWWDETPVRMLGRAPAAEGGR